MTYAVCETADMEVDYELFPWGWTYEKWKFSNVTAYGLSGLKVKSTIISVTCYVKYWLLKLSTNLSL